MVLYPDRENPERICQMLYWNQGAGGVHAVVMNGRNIDRRPYRASAQMP
jgi:hypothetical protein